MKEIKILKQQLRNYPDNWFVYSQERLDEYEVDNPPSLGLVVCTHTGEEKGFIELGGEGEVIIK